MGKAARWLKSLFGTKKDNKNSEENRTSSSSSKRGRRRWSFGRSGKDSVSGDSSAWLGRYLSETEREQNNHAIAVAAATAAAADAAVAAAQAAVAVVRLTSQGSSAALFCIAREKTAAVKIQSVFRGYLARKALRALKGLVKLQAHVRGYLVRKQQRPSLHPMHSLLRTHSSPRYPHLRNLWVSLSHQRFDESRREKRISACSYDSCFDDTPKIVEIDTFRTRSRSSRKTNYPPSVSDHSAEDGSYLQYPVASLSPVPARLSVPDRRYVPNDWGFYEDESRRRRYQAVTAHSTPRCADGFGPRAPPSPTKSVCGENEGYLRTYYGHRGSGYNCPNYMANTLSFRAKVRSQSAPRHRPEPSPSKRRLSMNDMTASRSSVGGVRMRKSCSSVPQLGDL